MKMGLPFSSTGDDAMDEGFDALLMRSINFNGDNMKPTLRSVSCNGEDSEPTILEAFSSGKLIIEGSLSFKSEETGPFPLETKVSIKSPTTEKENSVKPVFKSSRFWPSVEKCTPELPVVGPMSPKHEAALKLQKVYKSFRTRRQLADCAVIVEQSWWKLLDFALLKRSSVSYFDIEEPESAVSRWLRARRRAATVGKGSLKDEKAKKLALQHWLEAIDPRHRYGHNLHFYYNRWLQCESKQPFFYWLDVGEGKEVNIEAQCPRSKLQQQCIKYLGPKEREAYEVIVEDGKFLYKRSRELLDSSEGPGDSKWIFVLSTSKALYVGQKKKGTFQHSSFLAGGATSAAGRLVLENGRLKAVWPHSGHYRPTEENFHEFMNFLKENNVDLTDVKQSPSEDDEESRGLKSFHSEVDLTQHNLCPRPRTEVQASHSSGGASNADILKIISSFEPSKGLSFSSSSAEYKLGRDGNPKRLLDLEQDHKLHKKIMLEHQEENDRQADGETKCFSESKRTDSSERCDGMGCSHSSDLQSRVSYTSEEHQRCCKQNLFVDEQEEGEKPSVPQESILRRINSKKGMKSYQLGKQLSCKWTTGAGPRIGCVRDYPSELQVRVLEQLNLSPRTDENSRPSPSPRNTSNQSPRMPEEPFLEVPILQKPNFRRYSRGLA